MWCCLAFPLKKKEKSCSITDAPAGPSSASFRAGALIPRRSCQSCAWATAMALSVGWRGPFSGKRFIYRCLKESWLYQAWGSGIVQSPFGFIATKRRGVGWFPCVAFRSGLPGPARYQRGHPGGCGGGCEDLAQCPRPFSPLLSANLLQVGLKGCLAASLAPASISLLQAVRPADPPRGEGW